MGSEMCIRDRDLSESQPADWQMSCLVCASIASPFVRISIGSPAFNDDGNVHDVLGLPISEVIATESSHAHLPIGAEASHQSLATVGRAHIVVPAPGDYGLISVVGGARRRLVSLTIVVATRIAQPSSGVSQHQVTSSASASAQGRDASAGSAGTVG